MTDKFVVAYDGSPAAERALKFAVDEARHLGASIVLVHVLEWLPYPFLTMEELEERHKRRNSEMERARKAVLEPVVESLADSGIKIEIRVRYGRVAEEVLDVIKQMQATQLFLGRTGQSDFTRLMFGSVVSTMAQVATVPCTVVP